MTCARYFLYIAIALAGWSAVIGEEVPDDAVNRDKRTLYKKKCHKFGICNNGFGGQHGGYQNGYQGGYQGGYESGYQGGVPINIAISQSQSSANGADGGHASGYYPNNHQYNGGYPQHGYNQGHGGYNQGYGGYNQGYGGHGGYNQGYKPGYGNGFGAHNSQFNGNYYGGALGQTPGGGYGFQKPFYDEDGHDSYEDENDNDNIGFGRSAAVAKSSA